MNLESCFRMDHAAAFLQPRLPDISLPRMSSTEPIELWPTPVTLSQISNSNPVYPGLKMNPRPARNRMAVLAQICRRTATLPDIHISRLRGADFAQLIPNSNPGMQREAHKDENSSVGIAAKIRIMKYTIHQ